MSLRVHYSGLHNKWKYNSARVDSIKQGDDSIQVEMLAWNTAKIYVRIF